MNKLIINTLAIVASLFLVSACHTVEGFGKDMQQGGKELQKSANENK